MLYVDLLNKMKKKRFHGKKKDAPFPPSSLYVLLKYPLSGILTYFLISFDVS